MAREVRPHIHSIYTRHLQIVSKLIENESEFAVGEECGAHLIGQSSTRDPLLHLSIHSIINRISFGCHNRPSEVQVFCIRLARILVNANWGVSFRVHRIDGRGSHSKGSHWSAANMRWIRNVTNEFVYHLENVER